MTDEFQQAWQPHCDLFRASDRVRLGLVTAARDSIAAGTYEDDRKLDIAVDAVLDEFSAPESPVVAVEPSTATALLRAMAQARCPLPYGKVKPVPRPDDDHPDPDDTVLHYERWDGM